jgi:hypothetical protein
MVHGSWFMVHGSWFIVHGLWIVNYSLWFTVCGSWLMVYDWFMIVKVLEYRRDASSRARRFSASISGCSSSTCLCGV